MKNKLPKFTRLLATLLLYMVLTPFVPAGGPTNKLLAIVFFVVLAVSVLDLGLRPKVIGLVVALLLTPAVIARVVSELFNTSVPAGLLAEAALLTFLLFAIVRLTREMLRHDIVSTETIIGAVCVYLFIGFAFASAYVLVDITTPGSFNLPEVAEPLGQDESTAAPYRVGGRRQPLTYFSFVTLTTLGFGDITPATPKAGNLAILEAIIGQLFIAIIIARLVAGRVSAGVTADPPPRNVDREG